MTRSDIYMLDFGISFGKWAHNRRFKTDFFTISSSSPFAESAISTLKAILFPYVRNSIIDIGNSTGF